jgi:acid phosphatase
VASIGGEYFGMNNDNFNQIPSNVSSIIDLLESKGISWGEYQEDLPYTGFEGYQYLNQETQANDYVRKHNPAVIYNSVAEKKGRLQNIKNTTLFHEDLKHDRLPQWMFITPNMTSDGHDTSVTVAGTWTRTLLEPLLNDKRFMKNTLVLVTFDENHTYTQQNKVFSFLIGDAVPSHLVGTTDTTFYDHYSEISTVEANWDLPTLGRWDVGANVFKVVGDHTGDHVVPFKNLDNTFFNLSYPGIMHDTVYAPAPIPNTKLVKNGRSVFRTVKELWGNKQKGTYYNAGVQIPDGLNPPKYPQPYKFY